MIFWPAPVVTSSITMNTTNPQAPELFLARMRPATGPRADLVGPWVTPDDTRAGPGPGGRKVGGPVGPPRGGDAEVGAVTYCCTG